MGKYCINKSGKAKKVYTGGDASGTVVGTIYANECYALANTWAGSHTLYPYQSEHIYFRNSAGELGEGYIYNKADGVATSFLNYSFGNVVGPDGVTYKSFKLRMAAKYYNKSATYKGTAKSGVRVLTNDSTPGKSNPHLMNAMYVETGIGTNKWKLISGVNGESGFIDTGLLSKGSDASKIGVYGNW